MARKSVDEGQTAEVVAEQDVPFEEHEAPIEASSEPAALELVTDPGKKKVIVFHDAPATSGDVVAMQESVPDTGMGTPYSPPTRGAPDGLHSIHAGIDSLGPDPNFIGRPARANLGPIPVRSRTVFRTESGSEVRSYESGSRRTLTMTTARGDEVPFHSGMVDDVVGQPETPETLDVQAVEATPVQETTEDRPRRRFGFFGRRAPKPEFHADGKGDPSVTHIYNPAVVGEPEPELTVVTPPPAPDVAWDPDQTTVVFEEKAEPVRVETPRAPPIPPRPRRAPRRKRAKKVAAPKPRKAKARRTPRKPKTVMAYPGDNHPIIDIEGIGPIYAKRLEKAGITTTGQLAVAKSGRIAKKVKAPKKTVKGWQAQADLLKVKGVGPQYAEAMARAGIRGIDDLKTRPADKMSKQVTKYLDSLETTVVGQPVTPKRMAKWKSKAARMRKVKVDKDKLAIPTHGLPPPWMREKAAKAKPKKASARRRKK